MPECELFCKSVESISVHVPLPTSSRRGGSCSTARPTNCWLRPGAEGPLNGRRTSVQEERPSGVLSEAFRL
jgi:hypothetical protein